MAASKTTSKKSAKKLIVVRKTRPMSKVQEKLIKLFVRPNGATLEETVAAGANYPALMALKAFDRRGFKTSVVKKAGEATRYIARKA